MQETVQCVIYNLSEVSAGFLLPENRCVSWFGFVPGEMRGHGKELLASSIFFQSVHGFVSWGIAKR